MEKLTINVVTGKAITFFLHRYGLFFLMGRTFYLMFLQNKMNALLRPNLYSPRWQYTFKTTLRRGRNKKKSDEKAVTENQWRGTEIFGGKIYIVYRFKANSSGL